MDIIRHTRKYYSLQAFLLLALLAVNVANASWCCDPMSSGSSMSDMNMKSMPCHGSGLDDDTNECCVTGAAFTSSFRHSSDYVLVGTSNSLPAQPIVAAIQSRLYRPPIFNFS